MTELTFYLYSKYVQKVKYSVSLLETGAVFYEKEWTTNETFFFQNSIIGIKYTYSNEFFIGQSTSDPTSWNGVKLYHHIQFTVTHVLKSYLPEMYLLFLKEKNKPKKKHPPQKTKKQTKATRR